MRVDRISVKNFLSHRETLLDLTGKSLVIIVGQNGAGKSSLVKDSLTWGVFGKARENGDELITERQAECSVDIDIAVGENIYKIFRTRERGKKTTLNFWKSSNEFKDGESLTGATIADTQDKINKILGIDYETFTNSSCLEQGKSSSFTSLTPKESKNLLMKILQLSSYETYKDRAKTEILTKSAQLYVVDSELESIESQLNGKMDSNIQEWGLEEEIELVESRIEKGVDSREFFMGRQDRLDKEFSSLSAKRGELAGTFTSLCNQIVKISAKIKVIEENKSQCPLCKSSLDKESHSKILQEFNTTKTEYETKRTELLWEIDGIDKLMQESNEERLKLDSAVMSIQLELEALSQKVMVLREKLGAIRAKVQVVDDLGNRKSILNEQKKTLETEIGRYQTLEKAFSHNGIPALIIENVLPEIEQSANDILNKFSDGALQVEIFTQKELKTGETAETLEIKIKSLTNSQRYGTIEDGGEQAYKAFSGGEQFRVDLALRLALSRLLSRRNNFRVSTLILDEGLGSLDIQGRQLFVELMESLQGEFERILVITHTETQDSFKNVLSVYKENGESKISWLS